MIGKKEVSAVKNTETLHVKTMVKIHHLCQSMSLLKYNGELSRSEWAGDHRCGGYRSDNGAGDLFSLYWGEKRLAAVVFDHESSRSHFAGDFEEADVKPWDEPFYFFPEFKGKFDELIKSAFDLLKVRDWPNVTALYCVEDGNLHFPEKYEEAKEHGLWMLESFHESVESALKGGGSVNQSWSEQYGLDESQVNEIINLYYKIKTSEEFELSPKNIDELFGSNETESKSSPILSVLKDIGLKRQKPE
jgi:hypothetical protein